LRRLTYEKEFFHPDPKQMIPMVYADTMKVDPLIKQMDKEHERRLKAYRDMRK